MSDLFLLRLDLVRVTRQRQQSLPLDVSAYLVTRRRMVMIMMAVMMMAMWRPWWSSSCLCSRAPGALLSPARPPVRQHRYSACIKSYIITIFCLALRIILPVRYLCWPAVWCQRQDNWGTCPCCRDSWREERWPRLRTGRSALQPKHRQFSNRTTFSNLKKFVNVQLVQLSLTYQEHWDRRRPRPPRWGEARLHLWARDLTRSESTEPVGKEELFYLIIL